MEEPDAMGFLEHLDELRRRLIRSCIAVAAGMVVAWMFVDHLADFVLGPAVLALPPGERLIATRPGEGFAFYLDLALIGGVVLSAPVVTYQVWRFIAPGLYASEKRLVAPFAVLAVAGTVAGAAFSHYLLFPSTMAFFRHFDSPHVHLTPRLEDTFELYKNMLLAMVIVFQIPTLAFVLARMRIVTARFLWRQLQYAVLASFVVAAALTPSPDPWDQAMFAVPMIGLYLVGIVVAWLAAPRRRTHRESPLWIVVVAAVVHNMRRRPRSQGLLWQPAAER